MPTEQTKQADNNTLKGHIHLRNISFRYQPDMPYILDNFNLSIQAGETLGIVGTSGSGKSTLARLLLRLYTPEKGTILLDGTPLSSMNIHSLRRQIGIVLQENFLLTKPFSIILRKLIPMRQWMKSYMRPKWRGPMILS